MTALVLELKGDMQAIVTRRFQAPPSLVFRAHTEPALIRRWCLGPDGWTMPDCEMDARPGGRFRYRWANAEGHSFHVEGEVLEVETDRRMVHIERMFLPDPTPDNHVETLFLPEGSGCLLKMIMTLPSADVRDAMLATGMTDGMEISYRRMEKILGEIHA